jgi:hemerythrin-like domain-containing protein
MPYVLVEHNRYIGEHTCGNHHFGNMALIRPCCVADCQHWAETAQRVAMSSEHPAYRTYLASFDALTDAEQKLVPDFYIDGRGEIHNRR